MCYAVFHKLNQPNHFFITHQQRYYYMNSTDSKHENPENTFSKRLTKTDLNQLAHSHYGQTAYCEHVRTGQRGWYLYHGTERTFIGANVTEAFQYLQSTPAMPESTSPAPANSVVTANIETSPVVTTSVTADIETSSVLTTSVAAVTMPAPVITAVIPPEIEATASDATAAVASEPVVGLNPEAMLAILQEKFPQAFSKDPQAIRPLKIGIDVDIRQALAGQYSFKSIRRGIKLYTKNAAYFQALQLNAPRIDLNGRLCGEVTEEHIKIGEEAKDRAKRRETRLESERQQQTESATTTTVEPLVTGKLDINIKITKLPEDVRTTKNDWQSFVLFGDGYKIKVTVRPKTWKRLQKAAKEFEFWVASITGKIGNRFKGGIGYKGGFELAEPIIQIFQRKKSVEVIEAVIAKSPLPQPPAKPIKPSPTVVARSVAPSPPPVVEKKIVIKHSLGQRSSVVIKKPEGHDGTVTPPPARPTLGLKNKPTLSLKKGSDKK